MTISLCMIVRDEERNLPTCLDSCKGFFSDLTIIDTGSTDRTVSIARKYGARVYRFPWVNDFSAARNYGLDRARGSYIFRMDADDRIDRSQHKKLRTTLASLGSRPQIALAFRIVAKESNGADGISDEIRLWPNRPEIRFTGRVHERIRLEVLAPDVSIHMTDVRISHEGYSDHATLRRKLHRNRLILEADLLLRPDDVTVPFDLGRTYYGLKQYPEGIGQLRRFIGKLTPALAMSGRTAYRLLVEMLRDTADIRDAFAAAQEGLARYPDDGPLYALMADLLADQGLDELAVEGYQRALAVCREDRLEFGISHQFVSHIRSQIERLTERMTVAATTSSVGDVFAFTPG